MTQQIIKSQASQNPSSRRTAKMILTDPLQVQTHCGSEKGIDVSANAPFIFMTNKGMTRLTNARYSDASLEEL
ncbi:hypothetical protein A0J61_08025 [Choanephora cucurbitarum]|uniref:Uncharacterized protein n=1 Tax=Choanephora cucurbitarum TaxID=101091 RepID=A0A1C7N4E3_9FUNG|nr:hypothetical protein A0J61_08025 [Choanephora cucurbitarum]